MPSPHHRLLFKAFSSLTSLNTSPSSFISLSRLHCRVPTSLHLATSTSSPRFISFIRRVDMPFKHRGGHSAGERLHWKEKPRAVSVSNVTDNIGNLSIADHAGPNEMGAGFSGSSSALQFGTMPAMPANSIAKGRQQGVWMPKTYGTASEVVASAAPSAAPLSTENETEVSSAGSLSRLFQGKLDENFVIDNNTFSRSQIRATFYPKFENEKSDQEIRAKMIDMVTHGLATVEVSLKHSGSLFMYAGHLGGAYAKNSFGNIYTAVGVFVLARTFQEAWGDMAIKKQAEFNDYLEENRMCISMELVTAVLGDHGQRPIDDYGSYLTERRISRLQGRSRGGFALCFR